MTIPPAPKWRDFLMVVSHVIPGVLFVVCYFGLKAPTFGFHGNPPLWFISSSPRRSRFFFFWVMSHEQLPHLKTEDFSVKDDERAVDAVHTLCSDSGRAVLCHEFNYDDLPSRPVTTEEFASRTGTFVMFVMFVDSQLSRSHSHSAKTHTHRPGAERSGDAALHHLQGASRSLPLSLPSQEEVAQSQSQQLAYVSPLVASVRPAHQQQRR